MLLNNLQCIGKNPQPSPPTHIQCPVYTTKSYLTQMSVLLRLRNPDHTGIDKLNITLEDASIIDEAKLV